MSEFEVKEKTYNLPNEHRQVLNVIRNTSNKYITKTKLLINWDMNIIQAMNDGYEE